MAWFSPIKGAYPGLVQIDKTLPAASDAEGIVRGSVVYVTSDNTFAPCTDAQATNPEAYPFFALVGQDDFQAGMAGTVGYGDGQANFGGTNRPATLVAGGTGKVTALAVGMPMEFQTDQFEVTVGCAVGDYLTVGTSADGTDGLLVPHVGGANVVAQVTAVPTARWVNDATAVEGRRTGALVNVIQARTVWIPQFTAATGS